MRWQDGVCRRTSCSVKQYGYSIRTRYVCALQIRSRNQSVGDNVDRRLSITFRTTRRVYFANSISEVKSPNTKRDRLFQRHEEGEERRGEGVNLLLLASQCMETRTAITYRAGTSNYHPMGTQPRNNTCDFTRRFRPKR